MPAELAAILGGSFGLLLGAVVVRLLWRRFARPVSPQLARAINAALRRERDE